MLNIGEKSSDPRLARLSNFTDRTFVIDDIVCAGLEGFLQSVKCGDITTQKDICALSGFAAKRRGKDFNGWKSTQCLWWRGEAYARSSREYQMLITWAYDAAYEQDPSFRIDLLAIEFEDIEHSIGKTDMTDTVLTEIEMLYQLNRLRIRAMRDRQ